MPDRTAISCGLKLWSCPQTLLIVKSYAPPLWNILFKKTSPYTQEQASSHTMLMKLHTRQAYRICGRARESSRVRGGGGGSGGREKSPNEVRNDVMLLYAFSLLSSSSSSILSPPTFYSLDFSSCFYP